MYYEATDVKIEDVNLSINIQENKIRTLLRGASGSLAIKEDISKLTNYYFTGGTKINIGDEIYLFHANDAGTCLPNDTLGSASKDDIADLLEKNKENIFIKLVFKEKP